MSSVGQAVGYIGGAIIGSFVGNPMLGAAIGGMIGGAIDPPDGPKVEGPRLSDLSQQTASYGASIPRIYGTCAVFGNVFWIENNGLRETKNTESAGGKGGGGAEVETYTYSGTFAVGLCSGPIVAVRRIWLSGKLFYDAGAADVSGLLASNDVQGSFRVYSGSSDQLADPRMQATLGVGNVPAYRGLAYIVFEDIPLTDYGNTIVGLQVKVEVVTAGAGVAQVTTLPINLVETNRASLSVTYENGMFSSVNSGTFDGVYGDGSGLRSLKTDIGGNSIQSYEGVWDEYMDAGSQRYAVTNGNNLFVGFGKMPDDIYYNEIVYRGETPLYKIEGYGAFNWVFRSNVICDPNNEDLLYAIKYTGGDTSVAIWGWNRGVVKWYDVGFSTVYDNNQGFFGISPDGSMLALEIDIISGSVGAAKVVILDSSNFSNVIAYTNADYGDLIGWNELGLIFRNSAGNVRVYNPITFALISEYSGPLVKLNVATSNCVFYSTPRLINYGGTIAYLNNTLDIDTVPLSDIISTECSSSNLLLSGDIDVSGISDEVRGYEVASVGPIRSALEPLHVAWPLDVVQHGYKLKFKRRGTASSVASVPYADLGAFTGGEFEGRLSSTREMDSQLPCRVSIKYKDVGREYDIGEQYAERLNSGAINIESIELAICLSADEALQKAEVLLFSRWVERYDLAFSLPPTYNNIEPADIINIDAGNGTHEVRVESISYEPNGRLVCTAKPNRSTTYTSNAIGSTGNILFQSVGLSGATYYELVDCPVLDSALDIPGVIVVAGGYLSGWPGGAIYRSTDSGGAWQALEPFSHSVPVGNVLNIPDSFSSSLIDWKNILQVAMVAGAELSSVSEAAMFAGANHFAYGVDGRWEIIAAKTCVAQGGGNYLVSDLMRGRFGTEWAINTHQKNDLLILLSSPYTSFAGLSIDSIDVPSLYRGVTNSQSLDSDSNREFTYAGVNLMPLSPVYLNGNRHPSTSDWTLEWLRRGRVSGAWRDYVDVPVGEATEAYEVEIYTDISYSTVKRTFAGVTSATCAYTSAQQVADFGSNQSTLYVRVYQMSEKVGRGFPMTATITR